MSVYAVLTHLHLDGHSCIMLSSEMKGPLRVIRYKATVVQTTQYIYFVYVFLSVYVLALRKCVYVHTHMNREAVLHTCAFRCE